MSNFDPNSVTGLVGLWDFFNGNSTADTGLDDGIAQNGHFEGNAGASGDRSHFDGNGDYFDVNGDSGGPAESVFDMGSGTLEVQFTQDQHVGSSPDTVVNRGEYDDRGDEGYFGIQILSNGAVQVIHCNGDGDEAILTTQAGLVDPGDLINVKYSWDEATGVTLVVENLTDGNNATLSSNQTGLTMDVGDNDDEIFTFGAREDDDSVYDQFFDGSIDYVAVYEAAGADPAPDGIVDGEDFGEVMELGYDDSNNPTDQGGDLITNSADFIEGNGGDDTIDGEGGNDTIIGDTNTAGAEAREIFEWSEASGFANNVATTGFSQDTGSTTITFNVENQSAGVDTQFETDLQNTEDLDADVGERSSLESILNGDANSALYSWESSEPIENVEFRINDIDGDGRVVVRAFDEFGNEIPVTLSDQGTGITISGNTAFSNDDDYTEDSALEHSVLVTIDGPVSYWTVEHQQDGGNNSGINITDIAFDANTTFGEFGDDVIEGNDGDDVTYGDNAQGFGDLTIAEQIADQDGAGGDDTFIGGEGADQSWGEGGDDTVIIDSIEDGAGDVVVGGNGPDDTADNDVLDLRGTGQVTIDATADATDSGAQSGTVTFSDGSVLTFYQIETILTDPQNEGPDAMDDVVNVDEDDTVTFDPTANDVDPDGDPLEVIDISDPANGTLIDNGDGTYTYEPNPNFNGTDSVTYTVQDPSGETDTATITFNVAPVNDAPDAVNDAYVTDEEVDIVLTPLDNDTDVDGDDLTITAASVPSEQGEVTVAPDGKSILFQPADDYFGEATISYSITDGNGGTDVAEITVAVNNINDAPTAVDDIAETDEDTPVVIDLLGNDTDPDGDDLEIASLSVDPTEGSVVDNGDGTVTFTPAPDYNGPATITYTVSDGNGGTDEGQALVNVGAVNDGPTANDDTAETDEDTPVEIFPLGNDTDPDGDDLTITGASVPASQGTVEVSPDGTSLLFTPAENYNGPATISYAITDGNGGTSSAEVAVTVNPVNDDPVAVDDIETTDEDVPVIVDLLGNDSDVDGDDLEIASLSVDPAEGSVVDNGDGTVTFTPAPNFNGPATITYVVSDGNGGTDEGTATVNVGAVNDAPIAEDDTASTDEDTAVEIFPLGNDSDPDGDDISIISATVPVSEGTVEVADDGQSLTFTPAPDFNGEATITYTISDGNGLTDTAEITVDVASVGDAPNAVDDDITTDEDTPITFDPTDNDSDPDGDPVTVDSFTQPDNGTVTENPDGTLTYTPDPDYNGPDSFEVTVTDPDGNTATSTVNVTVDPVNDDPEANDDSDSTLQGTPVTIPVLDNDTDVDGDDLEVTEATSPDGDVEINPDGTITFTPAIDFVGDATIEYTVEDGQGGSDTATVTVTVTDVIGPVDGLDTGELMEPGYTDVEGDMIDGADGDDDTIFGNGGDDTIDSGVGDDTVDGGDGDDVFVLTDDAENIDNDVIIGGEGDEDDGGDRIDASDFEDDLVVDITAPETGTITDGTDTTTFEEIEQIETGAGDDTVTGSTGDDFVQTNGGDDSVLGGDGNDTLLSGDGLDTIDGGDGDDSIVGGDEGDELMGGDGNDTIEGLDGPDTIDGGDGDDSLIGGDADDSIIGGDGNDTVEGGAGDNYIDTSAAVDLLDDKNGDGFGFGPYGPLPGIVADDNENDDRDLVTTGSGDDTIITGDDDDTIVAGSGNNVIDAGIDDDSITTTFGDDFIVGGEGSDTISAGAGNDTIYGGLDPAVVPFDGADIPDDGSFPDGGDPDPENGRDYIEGGAGNDLIFGQDDDDTILGGGGADTIYGGVDDDSIEGGTSSDDIYGGQGADTMLGGDDRDEFFIEEREDGFGDVIDGGTGGNDVDELDLRGLGRLEVVNETVDADGDSTSGTVNFLDADDNVVGSLEFSEIENLIICFTPGAQIATPRGEVSVEELTVGDRVITRDDGVQEINWIGSKKVTAQDMIADPKLKPVLIRKGALGNNLPERDMMVSPNHRMLVANSQTQVLFEEREVLVAAKHLVGQPGVHRVDTVGTEYIHVMFERHQVILGDGSWTESFQPGDHSLGGIDADQRDEIFKLFPELQNAEGRQAYGAARQSLKAHEAKMLRKTMAAE